MSKNGFDEKELLGMFDRARNIRKSQGKSMEDVAGLTGMVPSTISRFENGEKVSINTASSLAEVYDVPLSVFMFGRSQSSPQFILSSDLYDEDFKRSVSSKSDSSFPEIVNKLSQEPVQDKYAAGFIHSHIDYEFACWVCKQLIIKRDGELRAKKSKLRTLPIDIAFKGELCLLPSFTWAEEEHKLSEYFYFDRDTDTLKSAMPTWKLFRIKNSERYASIVASEEAWELIEWFDANTKGGML